MKKVAIIGSGEFQLSLIMAAKEEGYQTHIFSWGGNESFGDFFYKISITEKELILDECKKIGIDGVCSIGSDLANITVNYVASHLGLTGNGLSCTAVTTNKYIMRKHLEKNDISIPSFNYFKQGDSVISSTYPVIVKPVDRSGSRGITLVYSPNDIATAATLALEESFSKEILVEQYINGREFSVESISYNGKHKIIQVTEKFTTGSPGFIEKGHTCPARITECQHKLMTDMVYKTLNAVNITNGAAHTELKINDEGEVFIIEIGSRMGGDFIGSDLVLHSTGFDFTKAVLAISMGNVFREQDFICENVTPRASIVKFIFCQDDFNKCIQVSSEKHENVIRYDYSNCRFNDFIKIASSADRLGYLLLTEELDKQNEILKKLGF